MPTSSLAAIFAFSFIIGIGAVISPGPVSTAIVSQAPRRGWTVGPLVATGHSILELCLVLLIALGLGIILTHPGIQTGIAFVGGTLLAWMGGAMIWNAWRGRVQLPSREDVVKPMTRGQLIFLGMIATISNPFWYAWWVTVAAGYLSQARTFGILSILAFYLGHITADYAWDTTLSGVVGGGRRWMNNKIYQALILACGMFFIYLGWLFLAQGFSSLN